MTARQLSIEILDYWHTGTGRAGGNDVDALAHRDDLRLPALPGRHLKGLLRHSARQLAAWGAMDGFNVDLLFGLPAPVGIGDGRHLTRPGCLVVSDARLPQAERVAFVDDNELMAALFARLSMTAIDSETGTARDETLRSIEAAVPLTLKAEIGFDASDVLMAATSSEAEIIGRLRAEWQSAVASCFPLIRAVGGHRGRGFGRAVVGWAEP